MRKGFDGRSHLFVLRGRRGELVKDGAITLTPTQLAMLLEGIVWRAPIQTDRPSAAA